MATNGPVESGRPADFPRLLSPLQVGPVTVPNRVVSTAHGAFLDYYRPGVSDAQYLAYQERRARGGCGLIILQACQVHPSSQTQGHYMWERADLVAKFRRMTAAIHSHGARVLVQLVHFGAQFRSDGNDDLTPLWGFSSLLSPSGWEVAHAMTAEEVEEVIDAFVVAAQVAVEGGLDGVELHAAHGYLLQQSFSPWANRRRDRFGQPLAFLMEVVGRVREAVGRQAVVGLRISAEDWIPPAAGGLGADGLRAVAARICESGLIDYLNHSEGARSAHYARAIADYYGEPGEFLPLTAGLREVAAGVPVVAVGKILTPAHAEQALADGVCDLVALTRAQIADPDLVEKVRQGAVHRIRPCVGANVGCVDRMERSLPITCFHNPDVGREWRLPPLAPAETPKRVMVVGAGPAGLKAAEIAARRGHRVTVFDRAPEAGGRLRLVAPLGPPAQMLGAVDWILGELELLGVELWLGTEVDSDLLADLQPEAVILATGVGPPVFQGKSDDSVPILSVEEAMQASLAGRQVVLYDQLGMQEQAFCAEYLAVGGAAVTLVTPFAAPGSNIGFTHIRRHLEHLHQLGVTMLGWTTVQAVAGRSVRVRHLFSRQESDLPADALVLAGLREPNLDLEAVAGRVASKVVLAGDVVAPRSAMHAFREGDNAGRAV
ncbi:MAG: N-methylproline demethylase [Acidimicrobiia bacterium]|nr:MAG: N-methylproline demethylase [Acidimicrobiia bacterium]